jgi:surface antigen
VISCASNTQQQNTVAGAATGAVAGGLLGTLATGAGSGWIIGAGVVAGALIGGLIGDSMDSSDKSIINNTMEKNPTNKSKQWKSKQTGANYKMAPTSNKLSVNGNSDCRRFSATSTLNGKTHQTQGTACRQANGNWQTIKV